MNSKSNFEKELNFKFMMIVSDSEIAKYISKFPDISLFVDLEILGKEERQGHLDTVKSSLNIDDVIRIRRAAPNANILVRLNPLNDNSQYEIDLAINNGADSIMIPMFHSLDDVNNFMKIINGRVKAVPLFETIDSIKALPEIISKIPLEQIHIGLNDLHLEQKKDFLFEPLSDGFLEEACDALRSSDVKFGIGGIARAGEGLLSPEYILGEHVRLGSSVAILSRAFHKDAKSLEELTCSIDFDRELNKLKYIYTNFQASSSIQLERNRDITWKLIKKIAKKIKNDKNNKLE
ncbi:MAG: aldolase [Gammaproteobacteria bacterium]|nr:aldolase [Gammaproteobacteria bacterium]